MQATPRSLLILAACILFFETAWAKNTKNVQSDRQEKSHADVDRLAKKIRTLHQNGQYLDELHLIKTNLNFLMSDSWISTWIPSRFMEFYYQTGPVDNERSTLKREYLTLMNTMGSKLILQGEILNAQSIFQTTIRVVIDDNRQGRGKFPDSIPEILQKLGHTYLITNNYAQAAESLRFLEVQLEHTLEAKDPVAARIWLALGNIYDDQEYPEEAIRSYRRARHIFELVPNLALPNFAECLSRLGYAVSKRGEYVEAEQLLRRALSVFQYTPDTSNASVTITLNHLALILQAKGATQEAEQLLKRALQITQAIHGDNTYSFASLRLNLASLYQEQKNYPAALQEASAALSIAESALGQNNSNIAPFLSKFAMINLAMGSLQMALPLFLRALDLQVSSLHCMGLVASESRYDSLLNRKHEELDGPYSLAYALPQAPDARRLALSAALLHKGRSQDAAALDSRLLSMLRDPQSRQTKEVTELRRLRRQIVDHTLNQNTALSSVDNAQQLASLNAEYEKVSEELALQIAPWRREHDLFKAGNKITANVSQRLQNNSGNSALVEFVTFTPIGQRPRYLALVLSPDGAQGQVSVADLGDAAVLDEAVDDLLRQLQSPKSDYLPSAQRLFNLIIKPLLLLISPQSQRLILSPDGQLNLVPFAALHDGKQFLIERFKELHYVSSGRDLLQTELQQPPATSVALFANPAFNAKPPVTADTPLASRGPKLGGGRYASLPGFTTEAAEIRKLLPAAQLWQGEEATKETLLALESPGILHVATHGRFVADESVAPTTASRGPVLTAPRAPGPRLDPLLRSMLVMAGANHPPESAGLATALEVEGMNLLGTQLVVLSACHTGEGVIRAGQGVYGLRRAVLVAGAETLVMSLWSVNDKATSELMPRYYQGLVNGSGRAAAMREAALEVRQKYPHPHYWAPFIVMGRADPLRGFSTNLRGGVHPPSGGT